MLFRSDALRRAFDATMQDAAFLVEAEKSGMDINARTGERLSAIVADLVQTPLAITEKTEALTQP